MALDFGNKVENGGIPPNGVLPASEFNELVAQVNKNEEDISQIGTPNSIESIEATESQESGGNNVITIVMTIGEEYSFNVKNGLAGEDGVGFSSVAAHNPVDGAIDITLSNGDVITLDLNHNHPQYYTKTEIDTMIGNLETLLANI